MPPKSNAVTTEDLAHRFYWLLKGKYPDITLDMLDSDESTPELNMLRRVFDASCKKENVRMKDVMLAAASQGDAVLHTSGI